MNNYKKVILIVFLLLEFLLPTVAQKITINQLGFAPTSPKLATVTASNQKVFYITSEDGAEVLYKNNLNSSAYWNASDETVQIADFSDFKALGNYNLVVPGISSTSFTIQHEPYLEVTKGALKALYLNRASTSIDAAYAGEYAREAGHPDNTIYIHSSAASAGRPEGTRVSAPKGWYDAGDFNKYVVNSGISTYQVLAIYEHFPEYFENFNTNIPESNNNIPDVLDEALWNLEWMLNMQDPTDGGVYHKLTSKNFSGSIMPSNDSSPRYMVGKGTAATLDFAAVMAQASRIFKNIPGKSSLANEMKNAAVYAYEWAQLNPRKQFKNPEDIRTGEYGDNSFSDEFYWASAELFITTGDSLYYKSKNLALPSLIDPQWQKVAALGAASLLNNPSVLNSSDINILKNRYLNHANGVLDRFLDSPYGTSMTSGHFYWASNSIALNQSFILLQAYLITEDNSYLKAAQANLDYILGRNPLQYCFVTGFGNKSPKHPHQRISEADGINDPVPGFLVGGANTGKEDGCDYPSNLPALSYSDSECSYASNEIAINWNSSLIYVAGAISALEKKLLQKDENKNYFTSQPISKTLCNLDTEAIFSATVTKSSQATLQWQVSSNNENNFTNINNDNNYNGAFTNELTISNVNPSLNQNKYRLVIIENGNETYSLPVKLNIYEEPTITTKNTCGAGKALAKTNYSINNFAWFNSNNSNEIVYRGDSITPAITEETHLYGGVETSKKITLIPENDFWAFYKGDKNPGNNWYENNFDDSRWKGYSPFPLEAGGAQKGENLAKNKPVSVSSTNSGNKDNITDTNTNSFWRSSSSEEEWAFIDLEEQKEFNRVDLYIGTAKPNSIRIEVSDNKFLWNTVLETDEILTGPNTYFFEISEARYVRVKFLSSGNRSTILSEFEVYEPIENPFLGYIANNYSTVYLRKDFEIGDPAGLDNISLNLGYQDGVVIWINGKKIISRNAPSDLSNTSLATEKLIIPNKELFIINEPDTVLKKGKNIIAVQLLNNKLSDPTIYLSLELNSDLYSYGSSCPRIPITLGIDTCTSFPNSNRYSTCEEDPNFIFFTKESGLDVEYFWNFGENATPDSAIGPGPFEVSYTSPGKKIISLVTNEDTTYNEVFIYTNEECYLSTDEELDLTEASISVYPNPFTNGTYLELKDNFFKKGTYTIIDINGRVVQQDVIHNKSPIYLGENLHNGMYFIKVETAQKDFALKIIKE